MSCKLLPCCQMFKDNLQDMPKSARYIQEKLCHGDFEQCNRYRMFHQMVGESTECQLNPLDLEAVRKVMQCLVSKEPGV
jgi:hypothetical protein